MYCLLIFSTLSGGEGGVVILVMIWDKNMQFVDCSKVLAGIDDGKGEEWFSDA